MCVDCQKIENLKQGWATKSPPNEKLKKNNFRKRWFVLTVMKLCKKCAASSNSAHSLLIFYYTNETESTLKGVFNLDDATVEIVDHITEDVPLKYRDCQQVIRWQMPRHQDRVLYTIFDEQKDKIEWMNAFERFETMYKHSIEKSMYEENTKEIIVRNEAATTHDDENNNNSHSFHGNEINSTNLLNVKESSFNGLDHQDLYEEFMDEF